MSPTPPLPVTEDTPPDMLAGSMDLLVVLPNGRSVKMSVERSTPMMDLLVQVTTANKIPPGGHVIQAMGDRGVLPYKPSTPIGALDTWSIQVVTKSSLGGRKAPLRPSNQQPFEQTFRLQVHLPRNQLFVTRVSSKIALSDILSQVCVEKNLDPEKYELRHPGNLDQVLDARSSLADYKLQEVVLVARSTRPLSLASTDIMVLHREEEKRRQQAKSGSTSSSSTSRFFGAVFKRSNRSSAEGSISSDSLGGRSSSPTRSDESASRSASPPVPSLPPMMAQPPPRPQRKRRPAPKPPASNNNFINNNNSNNKTGDQQLEEAQPSSGSNKPGQVSEKDGGVIISHSRNSSDSSGYHEASVLSESPDSHAGPQGYQGPSDTLPRRSKLTSVRQDPVVEHPHTLSRSLSSLVVNGHEGGVTSSIAPAKKTILSASTTALASAAQAPRKKRVAPPPPPLFKNNETKQDRKLSDSLSEPVAPPRQAVGHRDDRLKTSSLDRNAREKAEGSMALDKSATLPTKTSLSKQGSSASSLENVSKTSLQSFSSMEEDIVEVEQEEEEEEEEDNIPLQKAPNAPPVKDPIVEVEDTANPPLASVLSSRRDADTNLPVDKLDAPPNPKPRRRPQQADSIGAFPRPIPRPRKLSIDLIESTEGSQTSEIVKTDELDYGMQEDLNDIKFVESNQNNDDTPDKESKEDTNNEEYNSFVENPPRDYTGGKELKIITKTKRDPKFDTFGLKSPTFQKSRKKWNFTDEQTLEHLSNVSIDGDYMVEETDTIFVVGSMVDNSEAEVFSPLSRPDVEPTFTRPNFRKSPTDSELEPQILRRSLNRDGRFPSSPKQWRDRKLDPTGSATSLRSMGEMPNFLGALANIGRWNNIEALHTAKEASPGWVLGDDDSELEGDSQEEDAAADDELPHEPDSRPAVRHQRVSSKQELPRSSSSSQKPPGTPSVSPAALPPPDLVPQAAASSAEGPLDVIDWEYQLPAPPTAFRDTNSPALVEGETVVLADTGVFREEVTESSLDSGDFSLQDGDSFHPTRIHSRNLEQTRKEFAINGLEFDIQREGSFTKISRVNPLFDAQQFEIDSQRIDQPKSQSKVSDIGTLTKDKPKTADTIPQEIIRDEPHIQKDASRSSSNVSIHRPTIVLESNQSGQLSNFKITTYQMPREPDKLFEGEKEIFKKPLPVSNRSHRYGSVGSVSSFLSGDGLYCDLEGKKFTSYAALGYDSRPIRTKSVGNLAAEVAVESERRDARLLKMASQQNVNEDLKTPLLDETHLQQGHRQKDLSLQSLQVLRNILPQLTPRTPSEDSKSEDTDIRPVGDVTRSEEEKVAQQDTEFPISQESCSSPIHEPTALTPAPEKVSSAEKFYTYQGPPSINLSSWSERPKVKVDIKADSDYRIGRGKDTHVETPKTESAREVPRAEAKLDVRRSCVNSADGSQILKEVAPPESSPPPTKVESTPLTMRLVSHNSVSSSKKSLSTSQILESIARENPLVVGATAKEPTLVHVIPSFLSPAQRADPSRVPIVRAVELKKPYKQQLQDNDSNLNVSINIVRKNEELLVNNSNNNNNGYISRTISSTNQSKEENPRTDSDSFTGVNSLAKKFSSGVPLRSNALGPKPFQPRAVSSYEFNNKDINKVYLNDNLQKTQGGHNILVKSSSTSNVSGPNVTVTSYDGSRRFTSVVGINKTLGPPPHGVAKTTEGASTQNIHQRPSGSSIVKVNGFTGARQPFMPVVKGFQFTPQGSDASTVSVKVEQQPLSTEVNAPKVRIQRSESAAYKSARNQNSVSINQTGYGSTERFIGNEASVKIQPGWRTGGVIQPKLSRSVSNASSVPPPPPPLMSGVVLRKTPQSRPKSFSFANPRDELMDAIRSHGGRERLRKVGSSGHSSLNVILKV